MNFYIYVKISKIGTYVLTYVLKYTTLVSINHTQTIAKRRWGGEIMENPILINSDEILLVVYNDDQNIGRSGPLDESQVLKIIDEADDAIQIFRINPSEKNCEDISEEIAEAYVKENIERLYEDSEVHYFI